MILSGALRSSSRLVTSKPPRFTFNSRNTFKPILIIRPLTCTTKLYKEDKRTGSEGETEHEGSFARTDKAVRVRYPEERDMPRSSPVQGRGGLHFKRTLASFSLEGRVGVVTGGARGLGLVMSQALVVSGADVAIVDLNKDEGDRQAKVLMKHFEDENPGAE
ncbi:MAG: hypothetical protein Q9187_002710, partial [Circinaria calcarea]